MKIELHQIPIRDLVKDYQNSDEEGVTAFGGKTNAENCSMLCRACNREKGGR